MKRKVIEGEIIRNAGALMPAANIVSFLERLTEAFQEHKRTERELASLNAKKDILVAEISAQFETYHFAIESIFAERKYAIDKHFEVVEHGVATNNTEVIVRGLKGISEIASSSPFASVHEIAKLMEAGRRIEL